MSAQMQHGRCISCGERFTIKYGYETRCYPCYKQHKNKPVVPVVFIPPDMVKALIRLCHPDMHNGSKLSHDVTIWLMELKNKNVH